jgi:argininosuccinate lyase
VGEVGGKLHTARSRNDQVATDVRLWLKRRLGEVDQALAALLGALLDRVESEGQTLLPGYTHLQRGQPVWLGHHLLAHAWALSRDRERLADARGRLDRCPLGAAALAGTSWPVDRELSARLLGFAAPVENAMDAVAARDHEQETVAACAIALGHLSRMAEELVLWSSSELAFVRLPEEYATGSSIMPQKRNPDAAELVRGKAARVHGSLQTLLGLTRSLPLAYNRDLQESREPLFDSVEATRDCLEIMAGVWEGLEIDRGRFEEELKSDLSLATELADHLAAGGVPFREAHEIVGRIVRWCEERGGGLELLTPEVAADFHERLAEDLETLVEPRAAVERRRSRGGTAWSEVERQVRLLRETLSSPGA